MVCFNYKIKQNGIPQQEFEDIARIDDDHRSYSLLTLFWMVQHARFWELLIYISITFFVFH